MASFCMECIKHVCLNMCLYFFGMIAVLIASVCFVGIFSTTHPLEPLWYTQVECAGNPCKCQREDMILQDGMCYSTNKSTVGEGCWSWFQCSTPGSECLMSLWIHRSWIWRGFRPRGQFPGFCSCKKGLVPREVEGSDEKICVPGIIGSLCNSDYDCYKDVRFSACKQDSDGYRRCGCRDPYYAVEGKNERCIPIDAPKFGCGNHSCPNTELMTWVSPDTFFIYVFCSCAVFFLILLICFYQPFTLSSFARRDAVAQYEYNFPTRNVSLKDRMKRVIGGRRNQYISASFRVDNDVIEA